MRLIPLNLLAAYNAADQRAIFFYLGLIVVLAIAVVIIALIVRRIFLQPLNDIETFTLSDIRRLHAAGELSDEEYQATRDRVIARSKAAMDGSTPETRFPDADRDKMKKKLSDESDKGSDTAPPADPEA